MKYLMMPALLASMAFGQQCSSLNASHQGGWKPEKTAPHDGTVVEMLETFGIAPWYDIFKWKSGRWQSVSRPDHGVGVDECLFWRPYKPTGNPYTDPTGGAQNSVEYWCRAAGVPYDKKTGYCKKP